MHRCCSCGTVWTLSRSLPLVLNCCITQLCLRNIGTKGIELFAMRISSCEYHWESRICPDAIKYCLAVHTPKDSTVWLMQLPPLFVLERNPLQTKPGLLASADYIRVRNDVQRKVGKLDVGISDSTRLLLSVFSSLSTLLPGTAQNAGAIVFMTYFEFMNETFDGWISVLLLPGTILWKSCIVADQRVSAICLQRSDFEEYG